MDVQTYFFRRTNMNALGKPRSWTDNLLWHHAAHTVDLFAYQCWPRRRRGHALAGPINPDLGIPMDMSIQLKTSTGQLCTLSLSFNNEGPLGTFFRYICDHGTYLARYDDLIDGHDNVIDVSDGRRLDGRHRAPGPRVRGRDHRGPRTERVGRSSAQVLRSARPARPTDPNLSDLRHVAHRESRYSGRAGRTLRAGRRIRHHRRHGRW